MPFNIGPGELILVLIIALIIVGPGKLPDVGAAIGKSLREFRRAASDVNEAAAVPPASVPPAAVPPPPTSAEAAPGSSTRPASSPDATVGSAPAQDGSAPDSSRS